MSDAIAHIVRTLREGTLCPLQILQHLGLDAVRYDHVIRKSICEDEAFPTGLDNPAEQSAVRHDNGMANGWLLLMLPIGFEL